MKNTLTFKQIAPKWAKSIKEKRIVDSHLYIGMYEKCVVGEAHGFRDVRDYRHDRPHYHCAECDSLGNQFSEKIYQNGDNLELYDSLETLTDEFVKHWNDKHVNG